MAGIQIDGVNNKIDFDDDADTSISSATDDTLVIESGGVNIASITAGEFAINEGSADIDFRIEGNGDANAFFLDGAVDRTYLGNNTNTTLRACEPRLQISGTDFDKSAVALIRYSNSANGPSLLFAKSRNASLNGNTIVTANDELGKISFSGADGTDFENTAAQISAFCDGTPGSNDMPGGLAFSTAADGGTSVSERMRIHASGNVEIGATDDNSKFKVTSTTLGENVIRGFANGNYTSTVVVSSCDRNTTNGTYNHFTAVLTGVAQKFTVADSGNVTNTNNSYGQISDERLKSNIVDANSQWDDIKALKVRNFKKADTGDMIQIGVVAQELEAANMNGLVEEKNPDEYEIKHNSAFGTLYTSDDAETKDGQDAVLYVAEDLEVINGERNVGDVKGKATHSKKVGEIKEVKEKVKSVKYSVLYMKAIKALQEAMAKIETLETKVAALEGN